MSNAAADAELRRGLAAREAGDYAAALRSFEAAIAGDPKNPAGFFLAADMHLIAGRSAVALKLCKTGLTFASSSPNRSLGLQVYAVALLRLGRRGDALGAADDAISNEPANAGNHRVLGQVLFSMRDFNAAEDAFAQALSLAPASVGILVAYARLLKFRRRLGEAQAMVERAALIEPSSLAVLILRGQLAFRMENLTAARDLALWALSRAAMDRQALQLLAMVKSRNSWLTAPFWWCSNVLGRSRWRPAAFITAGSIGGVLGLLFTPSRNPAGVPGAGTWLFLALLAYMLLCVCHVGWLVRRDLRQVKLRHNF